ncbi:MAG TPA: adenylosuccinate lyase [Desulfotomaculum sp.]|nr:MAG: Adenylosuccinate lyase [Desulfofundulus kuznetsovii]HAG10750.1 adenylosuccinate lyase [Desulfotomaculum sp.]HBY03921.1 adenylosuccinate lyase [Desulfotomaculum sp.]
MIERYTLPEMKAIWSPENKFKVWLDVEITACEAMVQLGLVPPEALLEIKEKANFDIKRIDEIEAVVNHDVIAFLTCVGEYVGEASKYIHLGLTSYDVVDTALSVLMKKAGEKILTRLIELQEAIKEQAVKHRYTLMMGRTHGVHAEPITFGLKMLLWLAETERNTERVKRAIETISAGRLAGAVGTYATIDPFVESYVCSRLGLVPARVSTQVLQRDRHAEYLTTLAIAGASLDKFAMEIRHLQRTEVREAEEFFAEGQKGSSAMPHKRNPIIAERISGLSRLLRGNAVAGMENVALWHERDISHSSVERVIIPDSTIALDYMLFKCTEMIKKLFVYPEKMFANMQVSHGLVFSQRVLIALVEKGISREQAYSLVQRNAMESWSKGRDFKTLLKADPEVTSLLNSEEIEAIFDYRIYLKNIDHIYGRFGL